MTDFTKLDFIEIHAAEPAYVRFEFDRYASAVDMEALGRRHRANFDPRQIDGPSYLRQIDVALQDMGFPAISDDDKARFETACQMGVEMMGSLSVSSDEN